MVIPQVSVLIPVYNAEATIKEALLSICSQSLPNIEIIVVDDGSEDASGHLLNQLTANDNRIRATQTNHLGLIPALNTGLKLCRAPYIARMDADDVAHPLRLEKQLLMFENNPELDVIGSKVESFPPENVGIGFQIYIDWQNRLIKHEDIVREMFIESPITHPTACIRKELLEKNGGYQDRGWPEDYDLWLRLAAMGARFAKVNEVLLYWREHENRLTRTDGRYSIENFLRAKAHYLVAGRLQKNDNVFVWGAGKTGRRFSKHLIREGCTPSAFVDIDNAKIGNTLRRIPIVSAIEFFDRWNCCKKPILLVAVASRGARTKIRIALRRRGLKEGCDYLNVA